MRFGRKIVESGVVPAGELHTNTRFRESVQAVGGGDEFGAHVALHHLQRRITEFGVDVGDRIRRDHDGEMPDVGVERGVEDALLGDLPGEDQPLGVQPSEQIVQRGGVEGTVPRPWSEQWQPFCGTIGLTRSGRSPSRAERTMSSLSAVKSP